MADDVNSTGVGVVQWHPRTEQFPLAHAFVNPADTRPLHSWLVVRMPDFVDFLRTVDCVRLCPIRVVKSAVSTEVKPLSDYVTVCKDVSTQTATRTYKYAEGLINLRLTEKGALLSNDVRLITVHRTCCKGCGAVAWAERATVASIKARCLHVRITSFDPAAVHTSACVPDSTASQRPRPLIAQHVAAKALSRVQQVRKMDLEAGVVSFDLNSGMSSEELKFASTIPARMVRDAFKNTRKVGREGLGDFEAIHRILYADLRRILAPAQPPFSRVVPIPAHMSGDSQLRVIAYHPAVDPSCDDVDNPDSWYWVIVRFAHDQRDMAAHGSVSGVSYDAKIKMIIDGMLVMPICTTEPALPVMPGLGTPANGCRMQHVTEPNYLLFANTEKAEVITAATTTIRDFLQCDQPQCGHSCVLEFQAGGGFTVARPACAHNSRPGLWKVEGFDAARHTHTCSRAHARHVLI